MVRNRLEVPYEEQDEESALEAFGRRLKQAFVRDESKYPTTGRSIDFSGVSQRDRDRMAAERKKRGAQTPVMGSRKNVDAGLGRGTIPYEPATPAPKAPLRPSVRPRVASKPAGEYVAPTRPGEMVQYDDGTLNPSEFGPATMGPSARPGPVMGSMENVDVDRIDRGGFEATPAQMRRGLFGEEISQEDWDAMTARNKAAGFYSQFKKGGQVKKKPKKMAKGGTVSSASKRGDGCAQRGKTKGRMV